jgi:predicted Zn finger-like uncharacterized protein
MIIICKNCNKKFDIDSNIIPDKGRLLQCSSCDHKWFFKKKDLKNFINPIVEDIDNDSVNIFDQKDSSNEKEINLPDLQNVELELDTEKELDEKIEINNEDEKKKNILEDIYESKPTKAKSKKQKNFKILNIFVVVIISFVAFIIIVDTFKYPIEKIVPNVEFILYNLYESIKDISLFIRDLT